MIFWDLDGVLADFDAAYTNLSGVVWDYSKAVTEEQKLAKWERIRACPYFFRDLPWIPGARDLILYVRDSLTAAGGDERQLGILSAATAKVPGCADEKALWIDRELPWIPLANRIIVTSKQAKNQYAVSPSGHPNVLVDDLAPSIADWEQAGGIGILFRDAAQARQDFEDYLNGTLSTARK